MALLEFIFPCIAVSPPVNEAGIAQVSSSIYTYYYPDEAVQKPDFVLLKELLSRGENGATFEGENNGREGTSVVVSPYFEAQVDGEAVPVYATLAYSGKDMQTVLHSYATVYVDAESFSFDFSVKIFGFCAKMVEVLPASLGVTTQKSGKTVTAQINSFGTYTYLFNGDDQEHGFTLFLKPYVDEQKEIAGYRALYGEENVTVFEPGVHRFDYLDVKKDNSVIYLRAGALLLPEHKFEMTKAEDDWSISEDGALQNNSVSLARYPVINFYNRKNVSLVGAGTIDMTQLDWNERRGVVFSSCENIEMRGVFLTNAPGWTVIAHCCNGVEIDDVTILGYRTNSDGIAVTNTQNASVKNCFARSGDDLFEVKTLNTGGDWIAKNITFENCIAWNGKARCFGITHEVNLPISDVSFKNCAVIYRDAVWDNDIVCSLAVQVGEGGASVTNILFENIEIHKDEGRPINVFVCNDGIKGNKIENIVFKNVVWSADMKAQIKATDGNSVKVCFENVNANSLCANDKNTDNWLENNGANLIFR